MARAFWKGSISFGLVDIPVTLRPAIESHELSFSLLDRKDFSPVGYKRYNKSTGEEVPWDRIVRGYEYEPDEYVVLSEEELKRANIEATQTIEILEFVGKSEIDAVYFDTPYYIEPQKRGSKSYALLRAALENSDRVGIARVVLRTRQRLAAVVVRDEVLMLELLRYPYEVKKPDELDIPATSAKEAGVSQPEIKMAERLIDGMTAKWNPNQYKDEYHDDVMALVRRKVKSGQTHTILEPEKGEEKKKRRSEVVDLMPLLKKSLAEHGGKSSRAPAARLRSSSKSSRSSSGGRSRKAG